MISWKYVKIILNETFCMLFLVQNSLKMLNLQFFVTYFFVKIVARSHNLSRFI